MCSSIKSLRIDATYAAPTLMLLCGPRDPAGSATSMTSLFPALDEVEIGHLPAPYAQYTITRYDFSPSASWDVIPTEPARALDKLRLLFHDDGALRRFYTARSERGYSKLRRLHIDVPASIIDDDETSKLLSKSWVVDGADLLTFDASPPWEVEESSG